MATHLDSGKVFAENDLCHFLCSEVSLVCCLSLVEDNATQEVRSYKLHVRPHEK